MEEVIPLERRKPILNKTIFFFFIEGMGERVFCALTKACTVKFIETQRVVEASTHHIEKVLRGSFGSFS